MKIEKVIWGIVSVSFPNGYMDEFERIATHIRIEFGGSIWYFNSTAGTLFCSSSQGEDFIEKEEFMDRPTVEKLMSRWNPMVLIDTGDIVFWMVGSYDVVSKARQYLKLKLEATPKNSPQIILPPPPPSIVITIQKEPVIWVNNYGPSSHALFGVTPPLGKELAYYSAIRYKDIFSYNKNLTYQDQKTPGWIIRTKNSDNEVKKFLASLNISIQEF